MPYSMTKRKHDPRKRLRRLMTGCYAEFDGNGEKECAMYRPGRLPMPDYLAQVFATAAWRWSITISVDAKLDGATRTAEATYDVNQACTVDELGDWLKETSEAMAAEFPSMWVPQVARWKAVVKG